MNTHDERKNILQGTLDLLILRTVSSEAMHGWGIMQRLKQLTNEVFQVTPGSLFPALQRLEESGWVAGEWGTSENNRRAKFYSITKSGRKQLVAEKENWAAITAAVARVMEGA
jgi:PadR family transcriptional regulator PadR